MTSATPGSSPYTIDGDPVAASRGRSSGAALIPLGISPAPGRRIVPGATAVEPGGAMTSARVTTELGSVQESRSTANQVFTHLPEVLTQLWDGAVNAIPTAIPQHMDPTDGTAQRFPSTIRRSMVGRDSVCQTRRLGEYHPTRAVRFL